MFCFCAESRRLARLLTVRYDAALEPAGLTSAQFESLSVVQALGEGTGRQLSERLAVDKTTLSRNLKSLLDSRLIASHRDEQDARQVRYRLTAKGTSRLQKATPLWQAAHAASAEELGSYAPSAQRALERMTAALR